MISFAFETYEGALVRTVVPSEGVRDALADLFPLRSMGAKSPTCPQLVPQIILHVNSLTAERIMTAARGRCMPLRVAEALLRVRMKLELLERASDAFRRQQQAEAEAKAAADAKAAAAAKPARSRRGKKSR